MASSRPKGGESGANTQSISAKSFVGAFSQSKDEANRQLARFIKSHLRMSRGQVGMVYGADQIHSLLVKVKTILQSQETLVRAKAPIKIVGDLHGQYTDLKRILTANGRPPETKYLFLGDYIDRGKHSLECIMLLFSYKSLYPDSIVLLRGNHECRETNLTYGFYDELNRRNLAHLYPEFNDVFDWMPLAGLINGKILCMHGGISKHINDISQINRIQRPCSMDPDKVPEIATDLIWADPDRDVLGYKASNRGISSLFGMDALEKFCVKTKVEVVVRGHQVVERGFERMGTGQKTRLVTVFSAPNYCNEFDNSAAVMTITASLQIQFSVLEPSADATYLADRLLDRQNTPKLDLFPSARPK